MENLLVTLTQAQALLTLTLPLLALAGCAIAAIRVGLVFLALHNDTRLKEAQAARLARIHHDRRSK